jgi:nucleoside-diphosphate-sugar epimerase
LASQFLGLDLLTSKIAIIGGNGFIGSAICRELAKFKMKVFLTTRDLKIVDGNFVKFDLLNRYSWDSLLNDIKPDIVINTAWETEHNKYWDKDTNKIFMKSTINFATACFTSGVKSFLCIGSGSEYGYSPGKCNALLTPLNPQDLYSESKVLTSVALKDIATNFGRKANWIRLFQPYGPGEKTERLIPSLIRDMSRGTPIKIKFPNHKLDFTHTSQIAYAIRMIASHDINFSINIGTGEATSAKDIALLLADIINFPKENINFNEQDNGERIIYVDPDPNIYLGPEGIKVDLRQDLSSIIYI